MLSEGFQLRSWFSKNFDLQEAFTNNSVGTVHVTGTEKVLRYLYSPAIDELRLTEEIGRREIASITKRRILSVAPIVSLTLWDYAHLILKAKLYCVSCGLVSVIKMMNYPSEIVYVSNRVKDIRLICARILEQFKIEYNLRFIQTTLNPADLWTRGLAYNTLIAKMSFWKQGPEFIQKISIDWSSKTTGCSSEKIKTLLSCSAVATVVLGRNQFYLQTSSRPLTSCCVLRLWFENL